MDLVAVVWKTADEEGQQPKEFPLDGTFLHLPSTDMKKRVLLENFKLENMDDKKLNIFCPLAL